MGNICPIAFRMIILCMMCFLLADGWASSGAGSERSLVRSEMFTTQITKHQLQTDKAFNSNLTGSVHLNPGMSVKSEAQHGEVGSNDSRTDMLSNLQCGSQLTGVEFESVIKVLAKEGVPPPNLTGQEMLTLRSKKFFIAACLHQSEAVLPHWSLELIRLLLALRQSTASGWTPNLFVSIYESGSTDSTSKFLKSLKGHLDYMGVPHHIVLDGLERGHRNRIDFIADIRNRALEPLYNSSVKYDHVLWLNDVFFCADGVAQMAFNALPMVENGLGADAVCGMDYLLYHGDNSSYCNFYDIWASHDMRGRNFHAYGQRVGAELYRTLWHKAPFQVFSCWNGMVVFNADLFQERLVSFRRNHWQTDECPASETELLFRDMWKLGRGKVVVSPFAASAYDVEGFRACAVARQPREFHQSTPIVYQPPPRHVSCCPLGEESTLVNFHECYPDAWQEFYMGTRLTENSRLVLLVFGLCSLGFGICHYLRLQKERPVVVGMVIVGISMLQVDYLNNFVSTLVFPLPATMMCIQIVISSALLLCSDPGLCFELWSKARNVMRWSLLSPLFVMAFTARFVLQKKDNTQMLLMGHGLLPLLALVIDPLISQGSHIDLQVLFSSELIGLSSLLYAAMDTEVFDGKAWWCWFAYASLWFAAHLAARLLILDASMDLSLRAMALVKNLTGLVLLVIVAIFQKEYRAIPEFLADLQSKPVALSGMVLSAMAYLSYSYYLNFLLRRACLSSVFVLHAAMTVLPLFCRPFECGSNMVWGHPKCCLICMFGCVWFSIREVQAPYIAWFKQRWSCSKHLQKLESWRPEDSDSYNPHT